VSEISTEQPIIRIERLGKVFHTSSGDVSALEDISLQIYQGEIFGIIGMSGAGKSTLVRCINFLEQPTEGTVYFDGKDLSKLSKRELYKIRQSIGMIFQQFNLLMQRTVLSNVCFPLSLRRLFSQNMTFIRFCTFNLTGTGQAEAFGCTLMGFHL
jgi:D-methionine transport system ATP-binding protein